MGGRDRQKKGGKKQQRREGRNKSMALSLSFCFKMFQNEKFNQINEEKTKTHQI